jgi:predicted acetyltransferase
MSVRLELVTSPQRETLANLLELYVHDLSAAFEVDIGPDGRFGYPKLDLYFTDPTRHHAYFIRRGDDLAGFALVTRGSCATPDPDVHDVDEYFVLRRFRRTRVGTDAAHLLWPLHPGPWVVRVSEANRGAHAFWQRIVDEVAGHPVAPRTLAGKLHPFRVYMFEASSIEGRVEPVELPRPA